MKFYKKSSEVTYIQYRNIQAWKCGDLQCKILSLNSIENHMKNALTVLISDFTLDCGPDSASILQNEVILFCMCVIEPVLSCQLKFQSQYKTRMNKQRRYSDPKSMLTLRADILQLAILKIGRVSAIGMRIHVFHLW